MKRNEKGFTLMELMVVIVIVAILAAVAVPLYINYVKDAQRTDAKAAIGAIITAEQSYYLKSSQLAPGTPAYGTAAQLIAAGFLNQGFMDDIANRWTVTIDVPQGGGFSVELSLINDTNLKVKYEYNTSGVGTWTP
jgi:prepilin-type N-terminal cleavage/methylation domain-containing protein